MEMLDAYDKGGELVKTQERKSLLKEIRDFSYRTGDANLAVPVFHLWLMNSQGDIYVVQRGDKPENPFLFDKTAGGHVTSGESYQHSLLREADEEIGVDTLLVEPCDYSTAVQQTDLSIRAVVREVDFNPWSKSVRTVREGQPWVKRDRATTYIGVYDGPVEFKDGEAIGCILMDYESLEKMTKTSPEKFAYDLVEMIQQFERELRVVAPTTT